MKPGRAERHPVPLGVRRIVRARSGYVCEACGQDEATMIHHRKLRSQGGTNDPSNLLHVSAVCHDRLHKNLDGKSYDRGLLVRRSDDPALVPVVVFTRTTVLGQSEGVSDL